MDRRKSIVKWLMRYVNPWLPLYYFIPLAVSFLFNTLVFYLTPLAAKDRYHWDMTTWLDKKIPVLPEFAGIYLLFFVFWVGNFILIGQLGRKRAYQFILADLLSRLVCGIFFVALPTTNVRPVDLGTGFWSEVLQILYKIDNPVNLFPSIHCLASWLCFAGIRSCKKIPVWYRIITGIMALLIFFSTLAIRQHVIADVAAAVVLAECMYYLASHTKWYVRFGSWMEFCTHKLFGAENMIES